MLVHGVHEHSGRYAYLASVLMARGIAVRAIDLRGHGLSEGDRATVDSFSDYTLDVAPFLSSVVDEAAGLPVFLMGHSMGGLVVASTVVEQGTAPLAGLILSSPALALPDNTPRIIHALAPHIARWLPGLPVQKLDLDGLSRDPTVVRAYREDPLNTIQPVKAGLGYEIVQAIERVRQHPEAFDVPLYLYHGTADRVTDPAGTRWLAENASSDDVTLRLFDGLYHETHNEPERDTVLAALADWIEANLPDPAS